MKKNLLFQRHFTIVFLTILQVVITLRCLAQTPNGASSATPTQTVNPIQLPYSNPAINSITVWDVTKPGMLQRDVIPAAASVSDVKQTSQYYDGLGRLIQTVERKNTPDGNDMVAPVQYDQFGREVFKYLPYASDINDGSFKTDPFNEQNQFYYSQVPGEEFYYSKTDYESSPLSRVVETYAPGNSWVGSLKGTSVQYLVNTGDASDYVRYWTIASDNGDVPTDNGPYPAGTLSKIFATDENGHNIVEYKDLEGHVILKKVEISRTHNNAHDGWLCTYYVYDDMDNLRFVIPPQAVDYLVNHSWQFDGSSWSASSIAKGFCFSYEYDERQRMIIKRVPGAGETDMVYDVRDRLIMTQDEDLRINTEWMVTAYDSLNRPIITGKFTDGGSGHDRAWQQAYVDNGNKLNYPNVSGSAFNLFTETFYDTYQWISDISAPLSGSLITTNTTNTDYFNTPSNTTFPYPQAILQNKQDRNMPTGTVTRVLNTNPAVYLYSVNFYDDRGRIIQTQSTNYSNSGLTTVKDTVTMQYSFSGQILNTLIAHLKGGNNVKRYRVLTQNTYDVVGRLTAVKKTIGTPTKMSPQVRIVKNTYNELGQLIEKDLGEQVDDQNITNYAYKTPIVPIDVLNYDYTIRGWLHGINKKYAENTGQNSSWFGMELSYDYGFNTGTDTAQLNGNITGERWRSNGDGKQRAYYFSYDMANRITNANYNESTNSVWDKTKTDFSTSNITYDLNGNIKTMSQMGMQANNIVQLDSLAYGYISNTNQLDHVTDNSSGGWNSTQGDFKEITHDASTDYTYDANGNLKTDKNKAINSSISYDYLNQPLTIPVNGKGSITYTYDALGNKLRKVTIDNTASPSDTTTTDYIGPFTYQNDTLQYITTEEGRARPTAHIGDTVYYDYFEKDHLGNVRVVLTDQKQIDYYPAATLEGDITLTGKPNAINIEQNYYTINTSNVVVTPSGMPGYQNNNGSPPYNNNPYSYTDSNSKKVYKLTGTASAAATGLNITLKVMSGDVVDIFGTSYWNTQNTSMGNKNLSLNDVLSAFLATPDGLAASKGATVSGLMNGSNPVTIPTSFMQRTPPDQTPMAYINYILFDERFQYVSSGFSKVDASGYKSATQHHSDLQNISVTKNGYLYVYCSNQSPVSVYFDNLQVILNHGPLVEETHYYPFGLTMSGISTQALNFGGSENKFGYNSKEKQHKEFSDNSGLEWYDYGARMYDAQIGRWTVIDPHASKYGSFSPYIYVLDNPLIFADRNGKDANITIRRNKKGDIIGIDISSTIWVKGDVDQKMVDGLNSNVSNQFKNATVNGVDICFNVKYKYSQDMTEKKLGKGENLMTVHNEAGTSDEDPKAVYDNPNSSYATSFNGTGNTMNVYLIDENTGQKANLNYVVFHESLHTLGLSDRYVAWYNSQGKRVSQADKGFEGDVMGVYGSFNMADSHYMDYINYFQNWKGGDDGVLDRMVDKDKRGKLLPDSDPYSD